MSCSMESERSRSAVMAVMLLSREGDVQHVLVHFAIRVPPKAQRREWDRPKCGHDLSACHRILAGTGECGRTTGGTRRMTKEPSRAAINELLALFDHAMDERAAEFGWDHWHSLARNLSTVAPDEWNKL